MGKKLKQLLFLNRHDLLLAAGFVAIPFLLVHLVTAGVMLIVRPDESIFISGMMLPIAAGLASFSFSTGNVQVSFSQAIRFSCNRKHALALTLGQIVTESAFGMVFGMLLLAFERTLAMPIWRVLSGNPGLLVDDFGCVWWGIPLGCLIGLLLGLWHGAMLLRFGGKAYWVSLLLWLSFCWVFPNLPWRTHEVTNILFPVLGLLLALAVFWSIWSLLRLSISK